MTDAAQAVAPPWRPWRLLRWVLAGVLLAVLLLTLVALPLTVFPPSVAVPRDADVVIVLAGGRGERLAKARVLMDRAVGPPAERLLISNGDAEGWPDANDLCGTSTEAYTVDCFRPDPDTTAGEARAIGALAAEEGWERIAVVTSTYHATRARLRIERCVDDDVRVEVVAATPDAEVLDRVRTSAREMAALTRDVLYGGEC
jgi:uncharacterized SAM-binding protein YcdF (DUF218 family)